MRSRNRDISRRGAWRSLLPLLAIAAMAPDGARAVLLFEDTFDRGISGWTAVQPAGAYQPGPMRWEYDVVTGAFYEQSNVYTDVAAYSPSATAVMLVNDSQAGAAYTFRARIATGDNDGCGLVFGFQDGENFYRVTFGNQNDAGRNTGFPWVGWNVDRKSNGVVSYVAGHDGTPGYVPEFIYTAGRPFDVTIEVQAGNRLSLTIVDDPLGAATPYYLVTDLALPTSAAGQVGLMTWGQSGGVPRGVRFTELSLDPVGLAGDLDILPDWTPVVPGRADGSTALIGGNGAVPIWSLALGPTGPYNTLHEDSDAYQVGTDIGGNTHIDFMAPTLVAEGAGWSDYLVTARIIPRDDDGHGLLLRYLDPDNFYRIALADQAVGNGRPWEGLSIQKKVGGVWSEIYHDDPLRYDPKANVPYDLLAAVNGNRLQVILIGNPTGAAQPFSYGPFDIAGGTVDSGGVGFFSWGMSRTEFDSIRVESVDGVPLQVSSAFGAPEPAPGLHGLPAGTAVTASVASPVEDQPGVRRIATGWTGIGSVPVSGADTSVTFNLNNLSVITWNWRTEYRLTVAAEGSGQIVGAPAEWQTAGAVVNVSAQPDPGHLFAGWAGDSASTLADLTVTMTRPISLTAFFLADSDGDEMADEWERAFFGDLSAASDGNPDGDAVPNLDEYKRGTDPTYAEPVVVGDAMPPTVWENTQRDPLLPGQWFVIDYGSGYRGAVDSSNDYRGADDATFIGAGQTVPQVSFQGSRIIVSEDAWNPAWGGNYTWQGVFTVGDNDGNCLYFRYQDERNWYRATIVGEDDAGAAWRAPYGVSVQKRVGGVYSEVLRDASIATDPTDVNWYKKVRMTITAAGSDFELRVVGWNAFESPPLWDPSSEVVIPFSDDSLATGRVGFGDWGQQLGVSTAEVPVNGGVQVDDLVLTVGGTAVLTENWEATALPNQLPAGWENPYAGDPLLAGDWRMTAHGSIVQVSNAAPLTSATADLPRADADAPVLLAPDPGVANYVIDVGLHPFDNDGVGLVYDYVAPDTYARVMLVSEASGNGRIPQGISISRQVEGAWADLVVGDPSLIYTPGRPLALSLANNNGICTLEVRELDGMVPLGVWVWQDQRPQSPSNRFGVTTWGSEDMHILWADAWGLPQRAVGGDLEITSIAIAHGVVTLGVTNTTGMPYDVQQTDSLAGGAWTTVAENQIVEIWTMPQPPTAAAFWRLVPHQ